MKLHRILVLSAFTLAALMTGCDNKAKWEEHENKIIQDFISSLGDTVYALKPSGLYYIELKPGTGISPEAGDSVYIRYKAYFLDYVMFGYTKPYTSLDGKKIGSGDLIDGVDEGLRYMKQGGKSRLIIPSKLAYGIYGWTNTVPANTPIIVTIDLVKVVNL